MKSTFEHWPEALRLRRGLLNGERVKAARELRGMERADFASSQGISEQELARRESGWNFWTPQEQVMLKHVTDFPLAFFVQEDPPTFDAPIFMSGHDEEGNDWCEVITDTEK